MMMMMMTIVVVVVVMMVMMVVVVIMMMVAVEVIMIMMMVSSSSLPQGNLFLDWYLELKLKIFYLFLFSLLYAVSEVAWAAEVSVVLPFNTSTACPVLVIFVASWIKIV